MKAEHSNRLWAEPGDDTAGLEQPVSIYQVHPGSWMRVPEDYNRPLTYAELAPKLAGYARRMNFTHVELLTRIEPRPTGPPEDLKRLLLQLHQNGLGVVLEAAAASLPAELKNLDSGARPDAFQTDGSSGGNSTNFEVEGHSVRFKWEAGWARNMLAYLGEDPIRRKFQHHRLLVNVAHNFSDQFLLPLSHEEVGAGRGSLPGRMPGDEWQKFANLRLLFATMFAQPGKKLIFMGAEFGQWNEWNPNGSLDWHLLRGSPFHRSLQQWVADLNRCYLAEPALYRNDAVGEGFEWVDCENAEQSTVSWLRRDGISGDLILAAFNFTPVIRRNHRLGVPAAGFWRELLNSDAREYGGSGQGNLGGVETSPLPWNFKAHSLSLTLPPLGAVFLKHTSSNKND